MDEYCQKVRQRLAERGLAALLSDEAALRHVQQCSLCSDVLAVLSRADFGSDLAPQPVQAVRDVSTPSVATKATAEPAASTAKPEAERMRFVRSLRTRSGRFGSLLIGVAALALMIAGVWTVSAPWRAAPVRVARSTSSAEQDAPAWFEETGTKHSVEQEKERKGLRNEAGQVRAARTRNRFGVEGPLDNQDPHMSREEARAAAASAGIVGVLKPAPSASLRVAPGMDELSDDPTAALSALIGDQIGSNHGFGGLAMPGLGRDSVIGGAAAAIGHGSSGAWPHWKAAKQLQHETPREATQQHTLAMRVHVAHPLATAPIETRDAPAPTNAAERLLARYSTLDRVRFIDANGYFANTYAPGDPELRSLQARLHDYDRASLLPQSLRAARLDGSSRRVAQPFDASQQAALSVYVSASERGITSARRMLVQVGLQATPRYSGRRPTMNIGIVLDAREPLAATANTNVRALLAAFAEARDASDKLALFAAGPGGGQLIAADAFRYGQLCVALQRLQTERNGPSLSLPDALQVALQHVRGNDDPNAPLGSSVVIVIAPRALGSELAQLEALAHDSAVEGVPVSVFGAGPDADSEQLSRLALAGQGNRRMLAAAADATQAVDRELSAVARVVARAVRLRIRLATGVQLIGVLGSHALDEVHAERVREAENNIDQRLRRNLGITQDRGEDEEGVQVVIPSFYAGDSHVLLLDVVAAGPGPIVDVSVRYKDLVQLGNGCARESLWLPNADLARGALQRNVLKNLLAYELAGRLRSAGDALAGGTDSGPAQRELAQALALLDSLGAAIPELRGDRELEEDRALTTEYLSLLGQVGQSPQRQFAADSLHLASLLKLQPRPEWDARPE